MITEEIAGKKVIDTFTLAVTNQGYWGRGSQQEDEDPLKQALDNARALGSTGKVKRGTIVWVSIILVTEDDLVTEGNLKDDYHGIFGEDTKVGDLFKPCVSTTGCEIWLGSKLTQFILNG